MLILTRRIGESVYIGDDVRLTVLGVRGTQVTNRDQCTQRCPRTSGKKFITGSSMSNGNGQDHGQGHEMGNEQDGNYNDSEYDDHQDDYDDDDDQHNA